MINNSKYQRKPRYCKRAKQQEKRLKKLWELIQKDYSLNQITKELKADKRTVNNLCEEFLKIVYGDFTTTDNFEGEKEEHITTKTNYIAPSSIDYIFVGLYSSGVIFTTYIFYYYVSKIVYVNSPPPYTTTDKNNTNKQKHTNKPKEQITLQTLKEQIKQIRPTKLYSCMNSSGKLVLSRLAEKLNIHRTTLSKFKNELNQFMRCYLYMPELLHKQEELKKEDNNQPPTLISSETNITAPNTAQTLTNDKQEGKELNKPVLKLKDLYRKFYPPKLTLRDLYNKYSN